MRIGFEVRGTAASGNCTIKWESGHETSTNDASPAGIDTEVAAAYFVAHPAGEVVARGVAVTTIELE